jgi:hypothetical protein
MVFQTFVEIKKRIQPDRLNAFLISIYQEMIFYLS